MLSKSCFALVILAVLVDINSSFPTAGQSALVGKDAFENLRILSLQDSTNSHAVDLNLRSPSPAIDLKQRTPRILNEDKEKTLKNFEKTSRNFINGHQEIQVGRSKRANEAFESAPQSISSNVHAQVINPQQNSHPLAGRVSNDVIAQILAAANAGSSKVTGFSGYGRRKRDTITGSQIPQEHQFQAPVQKTTLNSNTHPLAGRVSNDVIAQILAAANAGSSRVTGFSGYGRRKRDTVTGSQIPQEHQFQVPAQPSSLNSNAHPLAGRVSNDVIAQILAAANAGSSRVTGFSGYGKRKRRGTTYDESADAIVTESDKDSDRHPSSSSGNGILGTNFDYLVVNVNIPGHRKGN